LSVIERRLTLFHSYASTRTFFSFRSLESDLSRSKDDQAKHSAAYEKRKQEHNVSVSEYKRAIKSLDNEKSVLSAAVEARDSKLTKMEKLKKEIQSLKRQVEDSRNLKNQMVRTNPFYITLITIEIIWYNHELSFKLNCLPPRMTCRQRTLVYNILSWS
jgi:predicted nuclease with TOPRIM domain